jgi:hypothetical protein
MFRHHHESSCSEHNRYIWSLFGVLNCIFIFLLGYPPADNTLRDYLTTVASKNEAFDHADTFFEALFQHTLQTLQQDYTGLSYSKVASEFRKQMTQGQTMKSHNQYHIQFYDEVIREASRLRRGPQVCYL